MARHVVFDFGDGVLGAVGGAVEEEALLGFVGDDGVAGLSEPGGHEVADGEAVGVGFE